MYRYGIVSDPSQWKKKNDGRQTSGQGVDTPNNKGTKLLELLLINASDDTCSKRKGKATKTFWQIMKWASHMNITAVILPHVTLKKNTGGGDAQRKLGN